MSYQAILAVLNRVYLGMTTKEKVDFVLQEYGSLIFNELIEDLWCEKCNQSCTEIRIPSNKVTLPMPVNLVIDCKCGRLGKMVEDRAIDFLNEQ